MRMANPAGERASGSEPTETNVLTNSGVLSTESVRTRPTVEALAIPTVFSGLEIGSPAVRLRQPGTTKSVSDKLKLGGFLI